MVQQDLREMMLCQQSRRDGASRVESRRSNATAISGHILITGIGTILEVEVRFDVFQSVLGSGRARSIRLGAVGRQRGRYRIRRSRERMVLRNRNAPGRYSSKAVSATSGLRDIASSGCHASHFVGRFFRTFL
jgi:hypothetical protein